MQVRFLLRESKTVELSDIQIGDIIIHGGTPGHCQMIMDICENDKGEKMFLVGQGFMPAQQMHIVKHNKSENNPWYSLLELKSPFVTPGYTFNEFTIKRMP